LYARTFHFRLIAATPLQLHPIRAAISEIVISVSESNNTIRRVSSSLKDCPCTAIVSPIHGITPQSIESDIDKLGRGCSRKCYLFLKK
jgi:hypothetical protein